MHCSWREEQQQELEYPKQMPLQINPPQSGSTPEWFCWDAVFFPSCGKLLCSKFLNINAVLFTPQGGPSSGRHRVVFLPFFFLVKHSVVFGDITYIKCTVMTMCLLEEKQPSLRSKALCVQHYFFIQLVVFKLFSFQPPLASINF